MAWFSSSEDEAADIYCHTCSDWHQSNMCPNNWTDRAEYRQYAALEDCASDEDAGWPRGEWPSDSLTAYAGESYPGSESEDCVRAAETDSNYSGEEFWDRADIVARHAEWAVSDGDPAAPEGCAFETANPFALLADKREEGVAQTPEWEYYVFDGTVRGLVAMLREKRPSVIYRYANYVNWRSRVAYEHGARGELIGICFDKIKISYIAPGRLMGNNFWADDYTEERGCPPAVLLDLRISRFLEEVVDGGDGWRSTPPDYFMVSRMGPSSEELPPQLPCPTTKPARTR